MVIFEMKSDFKDLLVEKEILNAINLAKAIDGRSPEDRGDNIGSVASTAIRLINDILTHLHFEIVDKPGKSIESDEQFEIRRTLL